jgi:hypothetical protein
MCDFLIDIVPREEAAKASNAVYDQAAYANNAYYQPQYPTAQIDPTTYYSPLPQVS